MPKSPNNKLRWLAVAAMALLLAGVRAFEDILFYDPLLDYYKTDFTALPWPEMDSFRLSVSLFFRYFVNTVLSLGILYAIFRSMSTVKFATLLYVLFFVVLIFAFFIAMAFDTDKMLVFYIRRFLIQPMFLLLFVPAFYFQERAAKKNNVS
jgi:exosortase F-associated protein